jgi:hypothetical protein
VHLVDLVVVGQEVEQVQQHNHHKIQEFLV